MEEFQKKATVIIIASCAVLVLTGLVIYLIINPLPPKKQTAEAEADALTELTSQLKSSADINSETELRQPHTIVIENVENTQQLSEILNIIETYSHENDVSNLKIECVKKEDMDSSQIPPPSDE